MCYLNMYFESFFLPTLPAQHSKKWKDPFSFQSKRGKPPRTKSGDFLQKERTFQNLPELSPACRKPFAPVSAFSLCI